MAKYKEMKIDPVILYRIITSVKVEPILGYKFIESKLISSDQEDGGGTSDLVIQHIESGKFYTVSYSEWDIENTDYDEDTQKLGRRCDLSDTITEVEPEEKTIIVYHPILA